MEKRYIVSDWTEDYDCETYVYDTADEANIEAELLWNHLTDSEKKRRHIYVALVTADQLAPDDVEEYGEGAWGMVSDMNSFPGAFDSEEV